MERRELGKYLKENRYVVYDYAMSNTYADEINKGDEPSQFTIYDTDKDDFYFDDLGNNPVFDTEEDAEKYIQDNKLNEDRELLVEDELGEDFYEMVCRAYVSTSRLEWVTTNPENNNSVVHGYFSDDTESDKYGEGDLVTPENFKEVAQGNYSEQDISNGYGEYYEYDTWEDFYDSYIKDEIETDIHEIGTYDYDDNWDFYISEEDLIKLGLWNEDMKNEFLNEDKGEGKTWDEIYKDAEGTTFGQRALKVKDQARAELEDLMIEDGIDLEDYDGVEDAIDDYLKTHDIRFADNGCILTIKNENNITTSKQPDYETYDEIESKINEYSGNLMLKGLMYEVLTTAESENMESITFKQCEDIANKLYNTDIGNDIFDLLYSKINSLFNGKKEENLITEDYRVNAIDKTILVENINGDTLMSFRVGKDGNIYSMENCNIADEEDDSIRVQQINEYYE